MKNSLLTIILLVSCLGFICATPQVPVVFNGTVTYNDNPFLSLEGYSINVSVGILEWNVGTVQEGNSYEAMVDPQGVSGDIYFYIGGIQALEIGQWSKGAFIFKNLTINSTPVEELLCGNGVLNLGEQCDDGNRLNGDGCDSNCLTELFCGDGFCNNGETCSSCSNDCGTCGGGDDDGGSSGGGGGGSSGGIIYLNQGDDDDDDQEVVRNINSNQEISTTPITGGAIGSGNWLTSGRLLSILASLIIVLAIIIFLIPKR